MSLSVILADAICQHGTQVDTVRPLQQPGNKCGTEHVIMKGPTIHLVHAMFNGLNGYMLSGQFPMSTIPIIALNVVTWTAEGIPIIMSSLR